MTLTATTHGPQFWIGVPLAFNLAIHFLVHFFPWLLHADPDEHVRAQVERVRTCPWLPYPADVRGCVLDVVSGAVRSVD